VLRADAPAVEPGQCDHPVQAAALLEQTYRLLGCSLPRPGSPSGTPPPDQTPPGKLRSAGSPGRCGLGRCGDRTPRPGSDAVRGDFRREPAGGRGARGTGCSIQRLVVLLLTTAAAATTAAVAPDLPLLAAALGVVGLVSGPAAVTAFVVLDRATPRSTVEGSTALIADGLASEGGRRTSGVAPPPASRDTPIGCTGLLLRRQ